jgi:hypothetical protein
MSHPLGLSHMGAPSEGARWRACTVWHRRNHTDMIRRDRCLIHRCAPLPWRGLVHALNAPVPCLFSSALLLSVRGWLGRDGLGRGDIWRGALERGRVSGVVLRRGRVSLEVGESSGGALVPRVPRLSPLGGLVLIPLSAFVRG